MAYLVTVVFGTLAFISRSSSTTDLPPAWAKDLCLTSGCTGAVELLQTGSHMRLRLPADVNGSRKEMGAARGFVPVAGVSKGDVRHEDGASFEWGGGYEELTTAVGEGSGQEKREAAQPAVAVHGGSGVIQALKDTQIRTLFVMASREYLASAMKLLSPASVLGEFIGTLMLVVIGCGTTCLIAQKEGLSSGLQVAFAFGFSVMVLTYAFEHYGAGQNNPAVTLAFMFLGVVSLVQGIFNIIAQITGALLGALVLSLILHGDKKDRTGNLASNMVQIGFNKSHAMLGEVLMTFIVVYTVLETKTNSHSISEYGAMANTAIGFAVFAAHCLLLQVDGCCLNPARAIGPSFIAKMRHGAETMSELWVFVLGPVIGALSAAALYRSLAYCMISHLTYAPVDE